MDGNRPTVTSRHGVVAAAHPLAAAAGARMLGRGGNAFDAAVAAAAALCVVEPSTSGLAGHGMVTCWVAGDRRVRTLAFGATVPQRFGVGRAISRDELRLGALAAAAPGNLAGWHALLSAHGTRTLADILAPAIELARDGFPLTGFGAATINQAASGLREQSFFSAWSAAFSPAALTQGSPTIAVGTVQPGRVLRQPDLAATLEAIAAEGIRHLYGGRLGQKLVAHVQALGGGWTMADLTAVSPDWGRPVSAPYRGLTVNVPPSPSQGFELLLTLRILEGLEPEKLERDGADHLDTIWRAVRLAAMERIGSDDPSPERLEDMLSEDAVARLRGRVADGRPIDGAVEHWQEAHEGFGQHSTSLAASDRAGNLVCITQSLGGRFGSGVVVPGTGVCLNNALYWGEPDRRTPHPRASGALQPGRAIATPMAPVIVTRLRAPVLALGTPGGCGITQGQAQALVQYLDFGLTLADAVAAPRARLWDGQRVTAESRIAAPVLAELRGRGHDIAAPSAWSAELGGMQAVAIDAATGVATGAADPRCDGYVATG